MDELPAGDLEVNVCAISLWIVFDSRFLNSAAEVIKVD
jgi:hypothetical protein